MPDDEAGEQRLAGGRMTSGILAPAGQLIESGFDPVPDLSARLRMFLGAYRLPGREHLLPHPGVQGAGTARAGELFRRSRPCSVGPNTAAGLTCHPRV